MSVLFRLLTERFLCFDVVFLLVSLAGPDGYCKAFFYFLCVTFLISAFVILHFF